MDSYLDLHQSCVVRSYCCLILHLFSLFWLPSYSPSPSTPTPQRCPPFLCCFLILRNIYRVLFNGSYHSRDQGAAVVIWCPFIIWPQRALSVRISHVASVAHNINRPHRTTGQKTGTRGPCPPSAVAERRGNLCSDLCTLSSFTALPSIRYRVPTCSIQSSLL